ncbi:MAG: 2-amino-4-hydroxy-6-hydroxymethyldihydropteridine diphosphokinase [Anaerolineae bacterium]
MATVYIALGTNLEERAHNLREAADRLEREMAITGRSAVYETEPWGVTDQPRFLNRVVRGETELVPVALLDFLKTIEREMGRTPTVRYGPRLIDLDILLYDKETVQLPDLVIPHPRLAERRFVLVPLNDLAPYLIHPAIGRSMRALLADLPDDDSVKLYPPLVQ